ncbi:MAG TPA: hypothetical protein DHW02_12005, partial [Ktedonobacter sp.]|nr:hypothetical protein [Ktedonobacter sp.]
GIRDVMLRLYNMSIPGRPERTQLIEQILPAAFVADLYDALVQSNPPKAWSKVANAIFFLDGFESLLDSSETSGTALRLLESLTLSRHRERGETDPFLVVLGTRQRDALEITQERVPTQPLHAQQTELLDDSSIHTYIRGLHAHWQQRIPRNRRYLALRDLYLPLWLQDFGLDDTRSYLEKLDAEMPQDARLFAEQKLVEAIHEVTHGHPLALALAAAAFQEADARGRSLNIDTFVEEAVSRHVVPGHENESIEHYLLDLFLRQLPEAERDDLIYCAAPRYLDAATQRAILQLASGSEAKRRWDAYRRLTFVSNTTHERIVFHPVVRALLRQLTPDSDPTSSYSLTHTRLQTHFQTRATQGDELARIEEAYHALALGNPEPAIQTGIDAQNPHPTLWEPLL